MPKNSGLTKKKYTDMQGAVDSLYDDIITLGYVKNPLLLPLKISFL